MTFAGWLENEVGLHREFRFPDFDTAWGFMTRVAVLAKELDHHPDWSNSWNLVAITLISHDEARVTDRDRHLAQLIDGVAQNEFGLGS